MGGQQFAAEFTLPGVIEGGIERVSVGSRFGEAVVVLVFYPSNFGPQSGQSAALLRAVEDLASEADAEAVGVAPESVYGHRQFADEAGIDSPLVSDPEAEVAASYGVASTGEGGQPLAERSLFVVDYRGVVVHEWHAPHSAAMPDLQQLRSTLGAITPNRSALGCYRVGYAQHTEGRRHLSKGLEHCKDGDWGLAGSAFTAACREFDDAAEAFATGQGLAGDETIHERTSRGRVTATTYWEAAEWLAGFATASRKGNEDTREESRKAAKQALQQVRDVTLPKPDSTGERVSDTTTA
jgi:peroxiredoxin